MTSQTNESETVTVCDKCLQASCWQGIFMCQSSQNAGTVEKTITELEALGLEHPHYWQKGASLTSIQQASALAEARKDSERLDWLEKSRREENQTEPDEDEQTE